MMTAPATPISTAIKILFNLHLPMGGLRSEQEGNSENPA